MTLGAFSISSREEKIPLYEAMPLDWAAMWGRTLQVKSLSLAFFSISRKPSDFSISAFISWITESLGLGMVLVIFPYSIVQETRLPSSSSGKSSSFSLRSCSKVFFGSVISSVTPPNWNTGGFWSSSPARPR